jgi:hypothetical protein
MGKMDTIIYLLIPIIVAQLGLQIYCILDIVKKGVKNLNKAIWIIICLNLFGAIAYLLVGRKGDEE